MIVQKAVHIKLTDKETYIWKQFTELIESLDWGLRHEGEDEIAYDLITPIENGMSDLEIYMDFTEERKK